MSLADSQEGHCINHPFPAHDSSSTSFATYPLLVFQGAFWRLESSSGLPDAYVSLLSKDLSTEALYSSRKPVLNGLKQKGNFLTHVTQAGSAFRQGLIQAYEL